MQNIEQFLKVVGIENGVDTSEDKVPFKTVRFQAHKTDGKLKLAVKGILTRVFWPATYERTIAGEKKAFKGDSEFATIGLGDLFAGGMYQCDTTPRAIPGSNTMVNSWKGVVFDGENPLVVAARALRSKDPLQNAYPLFLNPETEEIEKFVLQSNATGNKQTEPAEKEAILEP